MAGIDYGTVRIGIAVSNPERTIASPLENYTRRSLEQDAQRFRRLVADEGIVLFVVGLPIHLDGGESQKSVEARQFGQWLAETTGVPVEFFDERFTSREAEQFLLGRRHDAEAPEEAAGHAGGPDHAHARIWRVREFERDRLASRRPRGVVRMRPRAVHLWKFHKLNWALKSQPAPLLFPSCRFCGLCLLYRIFAQCGWFRVPMLSGSRPGLPAPVCLLKLTRLKGGRR